LVLSSLPKQTSETNKDKDFHNAKFIISPINNVNNNNNPHTRSSLHG